MRSGSLVFLALLLTLGAPAASRAGGSAFTPPAPPDATDAHCVVQNVGSGAEEVTAILHENDGEALDSATFTVSAGDVFPFVSTLVDGDAALAYCEFIGLSKTVRGYLLVTSGPVLPAGR